MFAKYHKISSAIIALLFLIGVQFYATPLPVFRNLFMAFLGFLILVGVYNFFYLRSVGKYNIWVWVRPLLFYIAWFSLFNFVPNATLRGLYLLASLPIIYFIEVVMERDGEQVLFNQTLISAFSLFIAAAAISQFYRFNVPGTLYLVGLFIFTTVLVRSSYEPTPRSKNHKWAGAVAIALFTTELFWALDFLPLHFTALGLLLFNVFYFCWSLYYYFLFNHLTYKKIQFQLLLTVLFTGVILLLTPWKIIQ
jgi:hypothetical protein